MMNTILYKFFFITVLLFLCDASATAQGCDPSVPTLNVNLSSSPTATYVSPMIARNGNCCGTSNPDRCLEFNITLHPNATAINFQITGGAVPPGALFYQINCGPPTPVGSPICLNGPGPHVLTFCKPGNNANQFSIISYPRPFAGSDVLINEGCTAMLSAYYYNEASITWQSVNPGAVGLYNSNLTCTSGCDTTYFNNSPNLPSTIQYRVCGNDINTCSPDTICHLISVSTLASPTVNISPDTVYKCASDALIWVSALVNVSGQPVQPQWSNGSSIDSAALGTGTHYVTITDTAGCNTSIDSVVVANYPLTPTVDAGNLPTFCAGELISLNGSASNGQNLHWSGGSGSFSNPNSLNSNYTPHATEINNGSTWLFLHLESLYGCPAAIDSVSVTVVSFVDSMQLQVQNVSCYGQGNGEVVVNMLSTVGAPFNFSLNGGAPQSSGSFTSLAPGTHWIEITNAHGCDTLISFNITQPDPLSANFSQIQNITCPGGADGLLSVVANGGTPVYQYNWTSFPSETGPTLANLPSGSYSVTITDANNCQISLSQSLTAPTLYPTVDAGAAMPVCQGDVVVLSGDTSNCVNPLWTGGGGLFSAPTQLNTTYAPTVNEFNNGALWLYFTVESPISGCDGAIDSLEVILHQFASNPILNTTPISCYQYNDGAAALHLSDAGDGPFTISLDGNPATTDTLFNNLSPGDHSMLITNAHGCDTLISFNITQPNALSANFSQIQNITCPGGADGLLSVVANGGTPVYQYNWTSFPSETGPTLANLPSGSYSVTITDANNCQISLSQSLTAPTLYPTVDAGAAMPVCQGDVVVLSGDTSNCVNPLWTGGGGLFSDPTQLNTTYAPTVNEFNNGALWLYFTIESPISGCDGAIDSLEVILHQFASNPILNTTPISCYQYNDGAAALHLSDAGDGPFTISLDGNPATTDTLFNNLSPGDHSMLITNAHGCDTLISFNITQPDPLSANFSQIQNITCPGGTDGLLSVVANGGTPVYQYNWTSFPSETGPTLANLPSGSYSVTITDANNCQISLSQSLTAPTLYPTVDAGAAMPVCQGDVVVLSGDTSNCVNPLWTGGGGLFSAPTQLNTTYAPTVNEFNNGALWLYFTVESPISGCDGAIDSLEVILHQFASNPILNTTPISCYQYNDGAAALHLSDAGDGPFTISLDGNPATTDTLFNNLSPGYHSILITNAHGCDTLLAFTLSEPMPLTLNFVQVEMVKCNGGNDGGIWVQSTGGNSNHVFSWSNAPSLNSAANNNLSAGYYTVMVTDQNGCADSLSTLISEPAPLTNTFQYDSIRCYGESTLLQSTPSGGTTPYSYYWGNSVTNAAQSVGAGMHHVQISDANGCSLHDTVFLSEPDVLTLQLSNDTTVCQGSPISMFAMPNGGTPNYTFNWSADPSNTNDSMVFVAHTDANVQVTVFDQNNCSATGIIAINLYSPRNSQFQILSPLLNVCEYDSVLLDYSYSGNTPLLNVYWQDCNTCGFPRVYYPSQDTTLYAILVTICHDTLIRPVPINIHENPHPSIQFSGTDVCPNTPIQLTTNVTNPSAWTFSWDLGNQQTSQSAQPQWSYPYAGTYSVSLTMTNSFGCDFSLSDTTKIIVREAAEADFEPDQYTKSFLTPHFEFTNHSTNASQYEWDFGDGNTSTAVHPNHTYSRPAEYTVRLIAQNAFECNDTTYRIITVRPEFALYIPNSFTPDQDRFNNIFSVQGFGLSEERFEFLIFNRWGELVFESHDMQIGWDGTDKNGQVAQDGVYVWKVTCADLTGKVHQQVGHVTLLR